MVIRPYNALRHECGAFAQTEESLALEAALHITINGVAFTTIMRTPGHDRELARGLLHTEGIITDRTLVIGFSERRDPETGFTACMDLTIPDDNIEKSVDGRRTLFASASCGVCGTRSPEEIEIYGPPLRLRSGEPLDPAAIPAMRDRMEAAQPAFARTGGLHGAAAFAAGGEPLAVHEDIGRHNAVDKVVGQLLATGVLEDAQVLFVSGRISYEIVYKAYRAGIPIILAVSAASSLAVDTAQRLGMTLMGFCRGDRATVYCHEERLRIEGPHMISSRGQRNDR